MTHCDHTSRHCECMTRAEAAVDANNVSAWPIEHGCRECGRCRAECRDTTNGGCGASWNCDVCGQELDDPITYIRCDRCKEAA